MFRGAIRPEPLVISILEFSGKSPENPLGRGLALCIQKIYSERHYFPAFHEMHLPQGYLVFMFTSSLKTWRAYTRRVFSFQKFFLGRLKEFGSKFIIIASAHLFIHHATISASMHMKKSNPLIVGNWKLNPVVQTEAVELAAEVVKKTKRLEQAHVAIAPSYPYLIPVAKKTSAGSVGLAAQDVSLASKGAFTGEVSVLQLKDIGCEFVILGHSERRAAGEQNESVCAKALLVLKHRLTPIVCVGEKTRDEKGDYLQFVEAQLTSLATELTALQIKKIVIAYEPIWAIGTGQTATVEDVKEMQIFIESVLVKLYDRPTAKAVRLLYGGSVKPHNAAALQAGGGMNGFLVGGASLKAEDFAEIISNSIS